MLNYVYHLITITLIYSLAVLGIQLQLGRIGLLNMGHIALMGVGGYTLAFLFNAGLPLLFCLVISAIIGLLIGAIIMAIGNPLKPADFCLASFGFLEAVRALTIHFKNITGGSSGLIITIQPQVTIGSVFWFYLLIFVILFYLVSSFLANSKIGLVWHSIKERESLAQSIGFSTSNYKIFVAAISGACSGLAGAFLTLYLSFIDPSFYSITYFIQQLSMAIIGGVGMIGETISGAFSLNGISEGLRFLPISSTYLGPLRQLFYALLLIIFLFSGTKSILKRDKI